MEAEPAGLTELTDSTPKSQRARRTCRECNRRKIKCDKNVPCGSCIRRGLKDTCSRPIDGESVTRLSPAPINLENLQASQLVQGLLDRVSFLENILQDKAINSSVRGTPAPTLQHGHTDDELEIIEPISAPPAREASEENVEIGDAATVLEFLAWGRRKDQNFYDSPENESGPRRYVSNDPAPDGTFAAGILAGSTITPQLEFLEALLPEPSHVTQLVNFHNTCLLWYHGSYMAMTLEKEVETFYSEYRGSIRHKDVNLQWVALLFAILTGSITCSSQHTATSWGFRDYERISLSKQWYNATITCLNLSNYLESHTIYSVQSISTLTISAHMLGLSNTQSVLLGAANRIAQSLGLHRLGEENLTQNSISTAEIARRRKREAGRRAWCQLCTQDWFSIPFSESYSLNPSYFNTAKPLVCNDSDMLCLSQSTPSITSYCNYLFDIASLIPQLQDAVANSHTLYTKYEQVLIHDDKMRKLATASMPTFLSSNAPVASSWPIYVPWARRSLAICAAHKIIMIHRKFLGMSFTNAAFAFTRRTCLAAARTILKEAQAASDKSGPVLWIDQAFTVAAGIILCLDAFHRASDEPEYQEHKTLVKEAVGYLANFTLSVIASRGIKLLSFLLEELNISERETSLGTLKRPHGDISGSARATKRAKVFNLSTFMKSISVDSVETPVPEDTETASELAWDAFADMFPPQTGFGGEHLFDSFFEFAK